MRRTSTDGKGNNDGFCTEPIFDLIERTVKVGTFTIHLVDEGNAGNVIFVRLPPDGFALGFNTFASGENDDTAVEDTERAFDFGSTIFSPNSYLLFPASIWAMIPMLRMFCN